MTKQHEMHSKILSKDIKNRSIEIEIRNEMLSDFSFCSLK